MELISFLKEFLAAPKHVGGLAPSSVRLAEMVTDAAGVSEANVVVEFGPGTGVFTEVIARKVPEGARFIAIEIQAEFAKAVRLRCPGVEVFHDSAVNTKQYLDELGLDHCDCIISGLPFTLFEEELQDKLLGAAFDVLRPGGVFVTFAYFYSPYFTGGQRFKKKLHDRFERVEETPTLWTNFLPAFAYRALKPAQA